MDTALFVLGALACPLGMLAMMGGMAWMARKTGSDKPSDADSSDTATGHGRAREPTHA
jgi:hypothetical protein